MDIRTGNNRDGKISYLFVLLCTWGLGLLVHGYRFFNMIYSMDSMLVFQDNDSFQYGLGRFMVPLYAQLRGRYYPPGVIGFLALTYIATSVFLIIRIFNITDQITVFFICVLMSTNRLVISLMSDYICFTDIQMCALLLMVAGVYLVAKYKWGLIAFIPLCVLSMGLYQAYFQVGVTLFIVLAVYDLVRNKEVGKVIVRFLIQMIVMCFSGGLYYCIVKLVNSRIGIEASEANNGIGSAFGYNSFEELLRLVINMYIECFRSIVDQGGNYKEIKNCIIVAILLIAVILFVKYIVDHNVKKINIVFIVIGIAILPAGMTCIYLASNGYYYILMKYSYYIVYSLALAVINKVGLKRSVLKGIYVLLLFFLLDNVVAAGNQYLHKDMIYQTTMFNMTRIIDRLEQTEGYAPGLPVVFAGDIEKAPLNYERDDFYRMTGSHFYTSLCYYSLYERYFKKLLGYPIWVLSREDAIKIERKPEVEEMPEFPAEGCIKNVEGVFVIKISNEKIEILN